MAKYEKHCDKHGPYPAKLNSCPDCSNAGGRPKKPTPLDEEDGVKTDLGGERNYNDDSDTQDDFDDMPTDIPQGRGKRGGINLDDDTDIGGHDDDDPTKTKIRNDNKKPLGVEIILWQKNGNRKGKILQIKNQDTIGKAYNCNHNLDGDFVSGQHAKVTLDEGKYYIWDMASTNGTYVNGERIYGRSAPLKENDIVKIDEFEFIVKMLN